MALGVARLILRMPGVAGRGSTLREGPEGPASRGRLRPDERLSLLLTACLYLGVARSVAACAAAFCPVPPILVV